MGNIVQIGKCKGCNEGPQRLQDEVCPVCLNHPRRGRKWADMAHRIRTDKEFAEAFYSNLHTPARKMLFISFFGSPSGKDATPRAAKTVFESGSEFSFREVR